jgi:hypothetical protein
MEKIIMKYYRGEFEVKIQGMSERTEGSRYAIETRKEVFLANPNDIEGYAESYAFKHSLFPGEYKFIGNVELAEDFNEITKASRGELPQRGLFSRLLNRE